MQRLPPGLHKTNYVRLLCFEAYISLKSLISQMHSNAKNENVKSNQLFKSLGNYFHGQKTMQEYKNDLHHKWTWKVLFFPPCFSLKTNSP